MQLTLSDDDARVLRNVLQEWLPELRRETARTALASRDLRHELHQRQALCERLLADLERPAAAAPVAPTASQPAAPP
jgi:hypothetical protein